MTVDSLELDQRLYINGSQGNSRNIEVAANPFNRVEVISDIDDFFAMRVAWNEINDISPKGNLFTSWEWLYTWWETYHRQGNRNLYILKCTNTHNDLLGIAPFQIVYNPKKYFPCSRQLVMLGTGETDGSLVFGEYMDLLIKQGHETAVIRALSDYLLKNNNLWDGLKFQQQLDDSYLAKLFTHNTFAHGKKIKKTTYEDGFRTIIELPNRYQDYLMSLRKKMRNNITRTYSRLESEKTFSIDTVTSDSEVKAQISGQKNGIQILAELNRIRRDEMAEYSVFEQARFELFHSRLVKRLLPLDKVSLRILRFDDEPVAALYSFVDKDTVHAYQSGFETQMGHRYSLLTTMLTQEIKSSIEKPAVSRFNFMYSNNEDTYKKRYAGNTEKMYNVSFDKSGFKNYLYHLIHKKLKSAIKKWLKIE